MNRNLFKGIISKVTASFLALALLLTIVPQNVAAQSVTKEDMKAKLIQALREEQSKYSIDSYSTDKNKKNSDDNQSNKNQNETIRVIIQFNQEPAISKVKTESTQSLKKDIESTKKVEQSVKSGQADIISRIQSITKTKAIRSFGYLVNGISINVKRSDIPKIKALNGVKDVTEVQTFNVDMQYANELTQAYNVWKDYGYKGEDMVVSVIDTGIDSTHKDLKDIDSSKIKLTKDIVNQKIQALNHGQYFTDKVPYGYNYADKNTQIVDSTSEMHGMHVAGIIGANGNDAEVSTGDAIKGVAPQAQLLAMKVFSNNPDFKGAQSDDIIAAIEDSVKLGADVINMSLGTVSGFQSSTDPEQVAIKNATDAGVLCVVSAGNSQTSTTTDGWSQPLNTLGLKDTSTLGNPAVGDDSFSVASYEDSYLAFDEMKITSGKGTEKTTGFMKANGVNNISKLSGSKEVVYCGLGTSDDFHKSDYGYLKGKIALVKRGEITFFDKICNAFYAGPDAIIVFNNEDGGDIPMQMDIQGVTRAGVVSIGYSEGMTILNSINNGDNIFNFEPTGKKLAMKNTNEGEMSQYSSWGPSPSLEFKPEITAPGGDIYSLANNNGYQRMSGTSMAAPNVSGAEALILQGIKGKNLTLRDKVNFIKNTAMNTSKIVIDKYNDKVPISPRRQGAGLIQIEDAIKNNVIATDDNGKAAESLKEIADTASFNINLKNYSSKDVAFSLENGGVLTEQTDEKSFVKETSIKDASMTFNKNSVIVKGNSTESVTVTIMLPQSLAKNNFVEGYVKLNCTDGTNPNLIMPYMGFYGDWSQETIVDKPAYSSDSLMKVTSLLGFNSDGSGYYLGAAGKDDNGKPAINTDDVAFSPNGDDSYEQLGSVIYMLRGAKDLRAEIVDKKTNGILRTVYEKANVPKNTIEAYNENSEVTVLGDGTWDGTLYNSNSGKYEKAPEGEYIYRIIANTNSSDAKYQVLDLPIKLDVTAPTVKIDKVEKNTDTNGKATYELQWEASDNLSNMNDNIVVYSVNNTVYHLKKSDIKCENGVYKANINFAEGSKNEISVAMEDYAGNVTTDTKELTADELKGVTLFNLEDGKVYNETSLTNGKFVIKGSIGNDISKLTINGADAEVKDHVLSYPAGIKEGNNSFSIIAYDLNNKEVYNQTYNNLFDLSAPEITITSPVKENETYTTDSDGITIKGTIKEANLSEFYCGYESPEVDEDGNFQCYVEGLEAGLNRVNVTAYDTAGHRTDKYITVMYNSDDKEFNILFENLQSTTAVTKGSTVNDVYTIYGYVNHKPKTFKINGTDVKVNDDLSFKTDVKLIQGKNVVTVYAEDDDANDNTVVYDWGYDIYYDYTGPQITINDPVSKSDGKVYTNQDSISIKGQVTDNFYGYILTINGDQVLNVGDSPIADEKLLTRAFEKSVTLKSGENQIIVNAVDKFSNTTEIKIPVVVDKIAPGLTVTGVEDGKVYNTSVAPKASASENSKIAMTLNGKAYDGSPITAEGKYALVVNAVDLAGNAAKPVTMNFSIDKTAPVITLTGVEDGKAYNNSVTPKVTANEESSINMTLNGKTYDGSPITAEGNYILSVNATDKAGNDTNKTITFSIDKTAPTITASGVSDGTKYDGSLPAPTFSAGDDKVTVTLDGANYDGKAITTAGYHVFDITAVDPAGNTSTRTINFSVNVVATTDSASTSAAIINSSSHKVDVVLKETTTLTAAVLASLTDADKQVSITVQAPAGYASPTVTWTFNTKEIDKSKIKDIDLTLNTVSPSAVAIEKIDKNAQVLSFKYHGELPAPAEIRVKVDPKAVVDGKVFLYYYNPDTKKAELIKGSNNDGSYNVDKDGYVSFTITHCSDYFLSSANSGSLKAGTITQTGSIINTNLLIALGALFIIIGAAFVLKRKKA